MIDLRMQALALPGTVEQPHHGAPSFRVAGKIFAQLSSDELTALLKLPLPVQEWVETRHPDSCHAEPGRWGSSGWTRIRCADVNEADLKDMIEAAWAGVTPKAISERGRGG